MDLSASAQILPSRPCSPRHSPSRQSYRVFSAFSGMRLLACLIVAPQRGYDEPAILSYAISSFCPTSADGLHSSHLRRKISGVVAAALVAPVRFAATVLHGPSGLASVPSSISTGPIVSTISTFLISFLVPVTGFTVVAIVGPRTQIQIDSLR